MFRKLLTLAIVFCFIPHIVKTTFAEVVINEFSSAISSEDWVELYNNSDAPINLLLYTLYDGSTNTKNFSCLLTPKGFTIINWNNTVNNDGDLIILKNENNTVDCVSYGDGAGKKCEGKNEIDLKKLEPGEFGARLIDGLGSWKVINNSTKDGPNDGSQKNSDATCINPTPTSLPIPSFLTTTTLTPTIAISETTLPSLTFQSYANIYLSEVMTYPESEANEWIELYNDNGFAVSLDNWYIDDVESAGSTPKKFSITIYSKSYAVFNLSNSIFNNDGDSVRLLDFNQKELDSFQYQSSEKGKTLGRTSFSSDIFCLQEPSKETVNNSCLNPTSSTTSQSSSVSSLTPIKTPTSIVSPTLKVITITVSKPTRYFFGSQNSPNLTDPNSRLEKNNILGITTQKQIKIGSKTRALLSSLSFISFSFSALSIISIIYKTKINS